MMTTPIISFDLDDTLWDNRRVIQRALRQLYDALTKAYPQMIHQISFSDFIHMAEDLDEQWPMDSHRIAHLKAVLTRIGLPTSQASEHAIRWTQHYRRWRSQVQCYPGVISLLVSLKTKYRLIAITNGNVDARQVGLYGLFEQIFYAEEFGLQKSNVDLYRSISRRLATGHPSPLLHIGDHWQQDVLVPAEAGWQTLWVQRPNVEPTSPPPKGYLGKIGHVLELPIKLQAIPVLA